MTEAAESPSMRQWADAHTGWKRDGGRIGKIFSFPSFRSAIVFVNRIATIADEMRRHPEIRIRRGEVRLRIGSPHGDEVSEGDLKLAEQIDFATSAR